MMKISKLVTIAVIVGGVLVCTQSFGAEQMKRTISPITTKLSPKAAIISCPSKIYNVDLSINSQYTAPSGWTAKTTPTGYQGQTLVISMHQVLGGNLSCTYSKTSLSESYNLTTVSKPVPAGKSCTAIDGFKFSCQ